MEAARASVGAIPKKPGVARILRIYCGYAYDADVSYWQCGSGNQLDIWRRPDLDRDGQVPVLL
ncbi:hypothetical protein DIJ64_06660 [Mycobacterium leprae]|uniref:Uncharacterized protein n=1 Tax=Mycobacterium leprae TaxID=1769 RepID=A0AAD0KSF7_MYCLR|nr:hypothetical protein DIJ64_06660 [Mycobacterium leprae]